MPILYRPAHSVLKMPASIILSMTVAADRALFVIAHGSGERMPARRFNRTFTAKFEAGLDEVKNSVGMNHALRNLRLVESSKALKA